MVSSRHDCRWEVAAEKLQKSVVVMTVVALVVMKAVRSRTCDCLRGQEHCVPACSTITCILAMKKGSLKPDAQHGWRGSLLSLCPAIASATCKTGQPASQPASQPMALTYEAAKHRCWQQQTAGTGTLNPNLI